jgi:hypothetical protein
MPQADEVERIASLLIAHYDDPSLYQRLSAQARKAGEEVHDLGANTQRLIEALSSLRAVASNGPA